jgi:hypothetical protein
MIDATIVKVHRHGQGKRGTQSQAIGRMKSREEQLTWAKQRALICVDMGDFSGAVAGLRAEGVEIKNTRPRPLFAVPMGRAGWWWQDPIGHSPRSAGVLKWPVGRLG